MVPDNRQAQLTPLVRQEHTAPSSDQLSGTAEVATNPRPVPANQKQECIVMERDLVEIGQSLRSISWPKRWPERFASALLGISVSSLVAALATASHHSAISGIRNGYWWLSLATFVLALIFYRSMSEEQEHPMSTVRRLVKKMEDLDWISKVPESNPNFREKVVREASQLLARALLIDRRSDFKNQ
jgi:hypothetical protein